MGCWMMNIVCCLTTHLQSDVDSDYSCMETSLTRQDHSVDTMWPIVGQWTS